MEILILNYRVWDQQNGVHLIRPRMATQEFIRRAKGQVVESGVRPVDERHVPDEGQKIRG
jgi:hypothetical protein